MAKELSNLFIFSEQDNLEDLEENQDLIFELIAKSQADIFIFDNITTSQVYGEDYKAQSGFAKKFKSYISIFNCSMIIFAHTNSSVRQSSRDLIDQNDLRGSKQLVNLAEFLYILQPFTVNEKIYSTIRIVKHRGQKIGTRLYTLTYNHDLMCYTKDIKLDFDQFKEIYKKQNKLG